MILFFVFWLVACPAIGQVMPKKDLSPADYHLWGTVYPEKTSEKGNWLSYKKRYDSRMDTLFVINTNSKQSFAFAKGNNGSFAAEKWFGCLSPQRQLEIVDLQHGTQQRIPDVEAFAFAGHKLVIQSGDKEGKSRIEIRDLSTGTSQRLEGATSFSLNPAKDRLLFVKAGSVGLLNLAGAAAPSNIFDIADYRLLQIVWNENGKAATFSGQGATDQKIWHYDFAQKRLSVLLAQQLKDFPQQMEIACVENAGLHISDDGSTVFFELADKEKPDDNGKVQVWNTADRWIYPDRIKNDWGSAAKIAIWQPDTNIFRRLTSKEQPMVFFNGNQKNAVTFNPMERQKHSGLYEKTTFYMTDLQTGEKSTLLNDQPADISKVVASPGGKYILYWQKGHWSCYDIAKQQHIDLTQKLDVAFDDNTDNAPGDLGCWGFAGWSPGDKSVFIYDQFDIWEIVPGKSAVRLTNGHDQKTTFRIAGKQQPYWIDNFHGLVSPVVHSGSPLVFEAFNNETMNSGLYAWSHKTGLKRLVYEAAQITYWTKAAGKIICTQERFDSPREIKMLEMASGKITTLAQSNPQQANYNWGHSELISFKTKNGKFSKAALYYPANYDATKKYPMVVNIYQRWTDELNLYENPSDYNMIGFNKANLTTQGYFVLQPDIEYSRNDPGLSALDYTTSATEAVIATGRVDAKKIALLGHSFGGYETNFIITQTDLFATAISGAAVADLTRFYLSVDFSTGFSQVLHFENQQWRMDKSLFDGRPAYDRNNPINFVQNVTTPLLSWTGEKDDHADWQQSIEFHLALRRLGKQNILLVYPGDDHTINDPAHQQDLTQKVMQWFGYYLKGEKKPDWTTAK